jgi:hypothetical protein
MEEAAMDWNAAIERNREALKRVLAMLVAMAGIADFTSPRAGEDGSARRGKAEALAEPGEGFCRRPMLPRHLHRAVLRLLRPTEAAVRRLVIVMARGLVVKLPLSRPRKPQPRPAILHNRLGTGILMPRDFRPEPGLRAPVQRTFSLPLLDPLPRWRTPGRPAASGIPRISFPGFIAPHPVAVRQPPSPDDPVDAARLALRLDALGSVLNDLPGQARRFARWRAARDAVGAQDRNRDAAGAQDRNRDAVGAQDRNRDASVAQDRQGRHRTRRLWPLRPGRPPGGRQRAVHEVHEVLRDLQWFAVKALERTDTS